MDQVSFGISGCVGVFVAAVLGQSVVFRAASLLPSDFNRDAFLIFGNGPMVGLALVVIAATTFWGCRVMLGRLAIRSILDQELDGSRGLEARSRSALVSRTALWAVSGIGGGLLAGAAAAWLLIAADGMGNGSDTSIVRYQVRDFVESSLLGVGLFLAAAMSLRLSKASNSYSFAK